MSRDVRCTPIQRIPLPSLPDEGLILDIGGGGEGIVSRIWRQRVCAVDIRMNKIREAHIYPVRRTNWLLCDGASLCFQNKVFHAVSFWFSLGYMRTWDEKKAVIREACRVLSRNGVLSILAAKIEGQYEKYILNVRFDLPDGTSSQTGYGLLGHQMQDLKTTKNALRNTGLSVNHSEEHEHWFRIDVVKGNHPQSFPKA